MTSDDSEKASRGWIGSKRAGYRTSGRRIPNGSFKGYLTDSSEDEDEESLERKLARLRREVAEVKEAFAKRSEEAKSQDAAVGDQESEPMRTLDSLGHVLGNIEEPGVFGQDDSSNNLVKKLSRAYQKAESQAAITSAETDKDKDPANGSTQPPFDYDESHALSKISDFDKRLRLLETVLGMDSVPLPTQDRGASRAVLPVLDGLDRQVSTILMTESSLDKVSRQIRQMTQDSEKLVEARKAAAAHRPSNQSMSERNRLAALKAVDRSTEEKDGFDQASKVNALYGTLSTIESLSPLLPSVLDRLQSLRAIHADAALASEALSEVEGRQAAMANELKEWKDGLEKVESAMQIGERSMKENVEVVDDWVKELETRLRTTKPVNTT